MLYDYQYLKEAPVNIEPREVFRFQGYPASSEPVQEGIQCLAQSQIDLSYRLIQPQALFRILPSRLCPGGKIKLESEREFNAGKATENWTGLKYLAISICTIGPALEK